MKTSNEMPYTHGMEVEQFPGLLPAEIENHVMNNYVGKMRDWHHDPSGPRECTVGPAKCCKTILDRFFADTRDQDLTWEWHAADSRGGSGSGAGSHVHLAMGDTFDDELAAWTITHNTVVEVLPFLAPYFCHDWGRGFRHGTYYSSWEDELNVEHWAPGRTTRYSQQRVESRVNDRIGREPYGSVIFNYADSGGNKPATLEIRQNDAHPAVALSGLLQVRRIAACAVEAGWSPKIAGNRVATLEACYEKIYGRATEVGLFEAMREPIPGGITFEEDRSIPGVSQTEFDTMYEVLVAIQRAYKRDVTTWSGRVWNLVMAGRDDWGPQENPDTLWEIDAPVDEFQWEHGPADPTSVATPYTEREEDTGQESDEPRGLENVLADGGDR